MDQNAKVPTRVLIKSCAMLPDTSFDSLPIIMDSENMLAPGGTWSHPCRFRLTDSTKFSMLHRYGSQLLHFFNITLIAHSMQATADGVDIELQLIKMHPGEPLQGHIPSSSYDTDFKLEYLEVMPVLQLWEILTDEKFSNMTVLEHQEFTAEELELVADASELQRIASRNT